MPHSMQRKAFVLLSGGLDSTTALFKAIYDYLPEDPDLHLGYGDRDLIKGSLQNAMIDDTVSANMNIPWVEAISIDYGQRHIKETEYAHRTCSRLGIKHTTLPIGDLLSGSGVMLSRASVGHVEVPDISYSEIKGVSPTYVPFRNGLMLSVLTAYAQKYVNEEIRAYADYLIDMSTESVTMSDQEAMSVATNDAKGLCGIYFGAHSEDAQNWAYPDCTPEFIGSMANAIYTGSYYAIRLHSPLQWLMKSDIVALGDKLGVPFQNTWSCYKGEEVHCGVCPTCRSRKEAFELANVTDPTVYGA